MIGQISGYFDLLVTGVRWEGGIAVSGTCCCIALFPRIVHMAGVQGVTTRAGATGTPGSLNGL